MKLVLFLTIVWALMIISAWRITRRPIHRRPFRPFRPSTFNVRCSMFDVPSKGGPR